MPAQDRRRGDRQPTRRGVGSSRVRAEIIARFVQFIRGRACAVEARRAGGVGPGSRSPWCCRIEPGGRSSPGAWRTPGRPTAAPPGDHAGLPFAANQQVRVREPSIGHPQRRLRGAGRGRRAELDAVGAAARLSASVRACWVRSAPASAPCAAQDGAWGPEVDVADSGREVNQRVWVPRTRSRHATCTCSCTSP